MKYSELIVWQKAMDLVTDIYKVTAMFPGESVLDSHLKPDVQQSQFLQILQKGMVENRLQLT